MSGRSSVAAHTGVGPGETVVFVGLASALVAGVVVWAGAALAAAVSGAAAPGGFRDAIRAIRRLVSDPARPGAAWPTVGWSPSPALYWGCTALVGLVVVAVATTLVVLVRMARPGRRRLGVDTEARFANRRELRPLLIRRPVPGRLVLGTWGRWLVATESQRWDPTPTNGWAGARAWMSGRRRRGRSGDVTSVAIIGPTRCGKTAECAIPAVLDWAGPAILLSVKRDLLDTTIARRRELGNVRVFDPGGVMARNENPAVTLTRHEVARWSPLRDADTASGAKKAGEALAAWTPKAGVDGGMDFWASQGKTLFTGLLGAAALSPSQSMGDVAKWVFNEVTPRAKVCEPKEILAVAGAHPGTKDAAETAAMHLHAIWAKDAKLQSSVYATATTVVAPWLEPSVLDATDLNRPTLPPDDDHDPDNCADCQAAGGEVAVTQEWVNLDWLMDTGADGTRANTLYLLVSHDDYRRLAPVLAGLLSDLKAQAYEWESTGRKFPAPLLMLIDEAGNMPLEWLPEVSSTCAGLGIQLVTVWQSMAQIHEIYGRRADVLLTNHATKLFFPAASDDSTLSYQSKIVGTEEVERQSWSTDLVGGSGRRSISGQEHQEGLVPYHVARLPRFGQALMIHSNTHPAQVTGRRWWLDRRLRAMVPAQVANRHAPRPTGAGTWIPTTRRPRPAAARPAPPTAPAIDDDPDGDVMTAAAAAARLTHRPRRRPPAGVDPATGEIAPRLFEPDGPKELSDAN